MTQNSFYWHDYETFGVDPQRDRAVQFAGIRTDFDFNIMGEPLVIYCKPANDTLPQPEACCVTGITPQLALEKGVCEAEFIALIHAEMAQENTCTLGYNNLRFDDEVTRNLLYRNFYDPYTREWKNGNSRWDLIDLIRTMHALRPDGIQWPTDSEGKISFRLEKLTAENGIEHADAHDALSDVHATISLARLIKQAQPKLFQYFLQNRGKHQVKQLLQLGSYMPVIHVSGMYGAEKQYLALVVPICPHPDNSNGIVVYDLSVNPEIMLGLSVEEIQHRIFTPKADLPEGIDRIPLKTVHINKCPIVAPAKVLRDTDAERLNIDLNQAYAYRDKIQQSADLVAKLTKVFDASHNRFDTLNSDPDLMIYSGGFFSSADRKVMDSIAEMQPAQLSGLVLSVDDSRIEEMLFRYRARNFPETLDKTETTRWQSFCRARLNDNEHGFLCFDSFWEKLTNLKQQDNVDKQLLHDLEEYVSNLQHALVD